jgi:hypothetical protein
MQFDLSTPLTLKFMGLGRPLQEAERLSGIIMTHIIMVLTIMGYRISFSDNEGPEKSADLPYIIPGIHTGIAGSECCGITRFSRGCPESTLRSF